MQPSVGFRDGVGDRIEQLGAQRSEHSHLGVDVDVFYGEHHTTVRATDW